MLSSFHNLKIVFEHLQNDPRFPLMERFFPSERHFKDFIEKLLYFFKTECEERLFGNTCMHYATLVKQRHDSLKSCDQCLTHHEQKECLAWPTDKEILKYLKGENIDCCKFVGMFIYCIWTTGSYIQAYMKH